MDFAIRVASAGDVPAMQKVRAQVRENRLADPRKVPDASYLPFIDGGSIWVARSGAAILGFAAVDRSSESVWALFVHPEAEGAGVGRALQGQLLRWAAEQGMERLTLSTELGTRAAAFYKQAGWLEIGVTPDGEALFEFTLPPTSCG